MIHCCHSAISWLIPSMYNLAVTGPIIKSTLRPYCWQQIRLWASNSQTNSKYTRRKWYRNISRSKHVRFLHVAIKLEEYWTRITGLIKKSIQFWEIMAKYLNMPVVYFINRFSKCTSINYITSFKRIKLYYEKHRWRNSIKGVDVFFFHLPHVKYMVNHINTWLWFARYWITDT